MTDVTFRRAQRRRTTMLVVLVGVGLDRVGLDWTEAVAKGVDGESASDRFGWPK